MSKAPRVESVRGVVDAFVRLLPTTVPLVAGGYLGLLAATDRGGWYPGFPIVLTGVGIALVAGVAAILGIVLSARGSIAISQVLLKGSGWLVLGFLAGATGASLLILD